MPLWGNRKKLKRKKLKNGAHAQENQAFASLLTISLNWIRLETKTDIRMDSLIFVCFSKKMKKV